MNDRFLLSVGVVFLPLYTDFDLGSINYCTEFLATRIKSWIIVINWMSNVAYDNLCEYNHHLNAHKSLKLIFHYSIAWLPYSFSEYNTRIP